MTILNVPDTSCSHCVARITKALEAENLIFNVMLDTKTVAVEGDEAAVGKAVAAMDDAGYESSRD